ncbi:WD40 repeat-like protein [Violaceomyces palustris]|uniref:WD40 repeat-like protein n=1 Tax=Violaceomyces palustris TaxID=1673888 RepID=A0ACD0NN87_9BASI|nr:WD40 repeat-like protein [Violaceomyces palustris]
MSKRPSSPSLASDSSNVRTEPDTRSGDAGPAQRARTGEDSTLTRKQDGDEEMGEFEDTFEDEFEQDDEAEIIYDSDNTDDDDDETMEVDGVKVDGKIKRPEDEEDEDAPEPATQAYIPGVTPLQDGQTLEADQSAYEMLHKLNVTWPCLSFDHLRDHLGNDRQSFPHTSYFVAGTQADVAKNNELMVMKASSLHKTQGDDDDSDDEDDDGLDDDAILEYRSIPVLGGINRVRAAPTSTPASDLEPCLDPYPVAAWSELGKVHIYDVRPLFNALDRPGTSYDKRKVNTPMFTVEAHRGVEGYAMDWAGLSGGGSSNGGRASSLRLLTGDIHSKIFLTTSNNSGFTTMPTPFTSHTSSVEDLQWSPSEPTVFASCSADRSIRVWDVRVKSRKSVIAVDEAHEQDVNVISWNRGTDYLLLSGGDEGGLNVWDLRSFKANTGTKPSPVAAFRWHTAPISSVEWHPTEDSVFAASGRDDQVTLWDLSVEEDEEEAGKGEKMKGPDGKEVPSQLLFCHHGTSDIKEVHWHPQIQGMLTTTALDGFNLFKTISV